MNKVEIENPDMTVTEYITFRRAVERHFAEKGRLNEEMRLPIILRCSNQCGGFLGVEHWNHEGTSIRLLNPRLAYDIALIEFGKNGRYNLSLASYQTPPIYKECDCADVIDKYISGLPTIAQDTGWGRVGGIASRGIHDYERTIQFERELTTEERKTASDWLALDKCPGWTGVILCFLGDRRYRCMTTWDSSD